MSHYCEYCNYVAKNLSNFINHKKTLKHGNMIKNKSNELQTSAMEITQKLPAITIKLPEVTIELPENCNPENDQKFLCELCKTEYKYKSGLSRHKKTCKLNKINNKTDTNIQLKEYQLKLELSEKEKELYKKLEKEKSELLNNFMSNANVLLNKANDNTKITAQTLQTVSMSALKYANEKFKDTPALLPIENFNINNLDFDNEEDKKQLVEILIYNAKQKSLDKLLGDHIIKYYKKENPEEQSFHTTDCSRLNYIVRELIENALIWSIDKNGIKICSSIVKPLIKKCIATLMEHQKKLLNEMTLGNFNKQKEVELIIDIIMSIDSGILEADVNKYIAPYFNLEKLKNNN